MQPWLILPVEFINDDSKKIAKKVNHLISLDSVLIIAKKVRAVANKRKKIIIGKEFKYLIKNEDHKGSVSFKFQ